MKNLILFFVLLIGTTFTSNASDPVVESKSLISTASVELSVEDIIQYKHFTNVGYNIETNTIDINTNDNINYIQIFSEGGELQYQLPVMSTKVRISKKMFEKGNYRIGFMIQGVEDIQFTNLKVN